MTKLVIPLLCALAACSANPGPVPPPSPEADAGPPLEDASAARPTCSSYCVHMRALGCVQGTPTPHGATCEAVCGNAQASTFAALDLRCGSAAKTCGAAAACERE